MFYMNTLQLDCLWNWIPFLFTTSISLKWPISASCSSSPSLPVLVLDFLPNKVWKCGCQSTYLLLLFFFFNMFLNLCFKSKYSANQYSISNVKDVQLGASFLQFPDALAWTIFGSPFICCAILSIKGFRPLFYHCFGKGAIFYPRMDKHCIYANLYELEFLCYTMQS